MQPNMQKHQLTEEERAQLLKTAADGVLATVNADGSPYGVPVQFVWMDGRIYIHGRAAGQKYENVQRDGRCTFTVYRNLGLLMTGETACRTTTKFESVIVTGKAGPVTDETLRQRVVRAISDKYGRAGVAFPPEAVARIGIIEVVPETVTGKYGGRF